MSRRKCVLSRMVLAVLLATGTARADFITNGSFEANVLAAGTKEDFNSGGKSVVTGGSGGAKLTFLDSPGSADNGSYLSVYGSFPHVSPDGGNFVEADAAPTYRGVIYQSVTGLTIGQVYSVSFYQAAGQQSGFTGPTTEQWLVGLGTTLALSESSTQASTLIKLPSGGVAPWQAQSLDFTASAVTEVLSFLANGTPDGEPPIAFLDGVSMNAVPEPSTMLLTGIGLISMIAIRARKLRKAAAV